MTRQALVRLSQVVLLVVVLLAWEFIPRIEAVKESSKFLDPFFISSPSKVVTKLWALLTGEGGSTTIWPFITSTVTAAVLGLIAGITTGALVGLILSSLSFVSDVVRPFLIAINAIPRIALIPVIVILFGATQTASIVICWLVVFFVAFFNSYEGGRTVAPHLLQNAEVMGANRWQIMLHIRMPFCIAWTLAAVPLAATFSVLIVLGAEIITGTVGMGRLLTVATATVDSTLTFAIVVIMSILGVSISGIIGTLQRRAMHWWGHS